MAEMSEKVKEPSLFCFFHSAVAFRPSCLPAHGSHSGHSGVYAHTHSHILSVFMTLLVRMCDEVFVLRWM